MNLVDVNIDAVRHARRIVVLGCSGGGKSTLSRKLSEKLDLPYISMDREFFWLPGWQLRERNESLSLMTKAAAGERWVMDGTSPRTLSVRLARADLVIWVRMPRLLCIRRVIGRRIEYAGRSRPEMADGCPERIALDFLRYIWNFERTETPKIEQELERHAADVPLIMLRKPADTAALLAQLQCEV